MAVSNYNTDPNLNTDISGINIAEGCPPSGINNAIRQMMADVRTADNANVKLTGNQTISGTKTFSGSVVHSGGTTFSGNITVRNSATFSSGLTVSGGGFLAKAGATVSGGMTVNGTMAMSSGTVSGTLTIASGGMIKLAGPNTNIPATSSASMSKYLRGDGNWADVTSAASAGVATKLGTASVGTPGKPIYLYGGQPYSMHVVDSATSASYATSANLATWAADLSETLQVNRGGTGKTEFTNTNGVITAGEVGNHPLSAVATKNGALYATSSGGKCSFGTLPIAQGGTGATTAAAARNALGLGNTSGALPVANGGTGATTLASAGIVTKVGASNVAFAASTERHGYYEINNGGTKVQVAWGRTSAAADGNTTITFAHAFGAAPFVVAAAVPANDPASSGNVLNALTGPASTTGAKVLVRTQSGTAMDAWVNYIAVGTGA